MNLHRAPIRLCCVVVLLACAASACVKRDVSTTAPTATCTYTLSAATQSASADGGTGSVTVTKTAGSCTWTAASNAPWLTFTGSATGSDTATLSYTTAANPSTTTPRDGTITVTFSGGTAQVVVTQAAAPVAKSCTFSVAPTSQSAPAAGGPFSSTVTTSSVGCAWTASTDAPWITITAGTSGSTTGTVAYTVAAAADVTPRSGIITVTYAGGSTQITVSQAGAELCIYNLQPREQNVNPGGGNFTLNVTRNTASGCDWSASTSTPWITLTGNTSGTSPGTITYSVAQNTDSAARTGIISISYSGVSTNFAVNQSGPSFTGSISLFDPGRQSGATNECQIRSSTSAPTTCTLTASTNLPTAVVTYDWFVSYFTTFDRPIAQTGPSSTISFQESCGLFAASDGGTPETLSVRVTMTDAVGNIVTVQSGTGGQPPLTITLFSCGK